MAVPRAGHRSPCSAASAELGAGARKSLMYWLLLLASPASSKAFQSLPSLAGPACVRGTLCLGRARDQRRGSAAVAALQQHSQALLFFLA